MGQTINVMPFLLPGVQEVWNLLLKIRDSGEMKPYDDYLAAAFELQNTEQFVGYGDTFISPDYDDVRRREGKYLPAEQQRDYENTVHAEPVRTRRGADSAVGCPVVPRRSGEVLEPNRPHQEARESRSGSRDLRP